jgi:TonB family protein
MGGAGSAGGVASAQPAAASKSLPFGVASIEEHAMPPREIKKPEDGSADASSPEVRAPNFPGEGPKPQEEQRAAAAVPEVTQPTQSPSSAANSAQAAGAASVAGASIPPADPAPQADTQSDPFSSVASVEFRRGKLAAQLGRRHRLTYPRFGIASIVEGALLNESRIALVITIDPSGHVKAARIAKSSGSANIDQAWRLTAYEWWFEPRKDPTGKPTTHDESFLFVITFS